MSGSLPWTELLSQICHCDLVPAKLNESNVHHPLLGPASHCHSYRQSS